MLKKAAALLLKGGTLTSEQCDACGGPQVRFEGSLLCINCGKRTGQESAPSESKKSESMQQKTGQIPDPSSQQSSPLFAARAAFEEKIRMLAVETRNETDIRQLKEKAELVQLYLEIIEKIHGLSPR